MVGVSLEETQRCLSRQLLHEAITESSGKAGLTSSDRDGEAASGKETQQTLEGQCFQLHQHPLIFPHSSFQMLLFIYLNVV